jgi:hypothetical protein
MYDDYDGRIFIHYREVKRTDILQRMALRNLYLLLLSAVKIGYHTFWNTTWEEFEYIYTPA